MELPVVEVVEDADELNAVNDVAHQHQEQSSHIEQEDRGTSLVGLRHEQKGEKQQC